MQEYIKKSDVLDLLTLPQDLLYDYIFELKGVWLDKNTIIKVTNCESGDWQILEIDGVEWASGHRLTEHDWLGLLSEHFDAQIECECISDEEMESRC